MKFLYDDGGRSMAGFKRNNAEDCVTRAISIATRLPYLTTMELVNQYCQKEKKPKSWSNTGVAKKTIDKIMIHLGFKWNPERFKFSDKRNFKKITILNLASHVVPIVDGIMRDVSIQVKDGEIVYGYWQR